MKRIALLVLIFFCGALHAQDPPSPRDLGGMAEASRQSPLGQESQAALEFLCEALCDNRVPSFKGSDLDRLESDVWPMDLGPVVYPVSFTFKLRKHQDHNLYCFTVQRDESSQPWHFLKAWKQTKGGKRLGKISFH